MSLTIEKLADEKQIPVDKLKNWGIEEIQEGVKIPYYQYDGTEAKRHRLRKSLEGGFIWTGGEGEIIPYGLHRLPEASDEDYLVLVEGESDTWTLWLCGINVLGIPGSKMTKVIKDTYLDGIEKILIHKEPDEGGETFVDQTEDKLRQIEWTGELAVFTAGKDMDLNELYCAESQEAIKESIKKGWKKLKPFEGDAFENNENIEAGGSSNQDENWGEPSIGPNSPDPLPHHLLPDWLEDFVNNISDFTQTPTDLSTILSLGVLSTALQGKFEIQIKKGFKEPVSLYFLIILGPANRKSAVYSKFIDPLKEHEEMRQKNAQKRRETAQDKKEILEEKLRKAKKAQINEDDPDPDMKPIRAIREKLENLHIPPVYRAMVADITPQKLAQVLAEQEGNRISVLSPEAEILPVLAGRYDSQNTANLDVVKKAVNNERITDDRISRDSTLVNDPNLSMAICVQPQMLQDLRNSRSFEGQGVLGRFTFAAPDSLVGKRKTGRSVPDFDPEVYREYRKGIDNLLKIQPADRSKGNWTPYPIKLSQSAKDRYYQFTSDLEKELDDGGMLESIRDWGGKLYGRVGRIATLLHIADRAHGLTDSSNIPDEITAETLERAVKFVWALVPHAKRAYRELERSEHDELKEKVLDRILSKLPEDGSQIPYRKIQQSFKNHSSLTAKKLKEEILPALENDNCIKVKDVETSGRNRTEIAVNPKLQSIKTPSKKGPQKPQKGVEIW